MGKIIWLASYPKSGNTWMRAFFLNLMLNASKPRSINDVPRLSPSDVQREWYAKADDSDQSSWSHEKVAGLRGRVQEVIAQQAPDSIFVKTHSPMAPWMGVPLFNMSVTAGAIYIVRNPLDIVASFAAHSGTTKDLVIKVMATLDHVAPGSDSRVPHPLGSWSQNVASWTGRPHAGLHVMRYEDMVVEPHRAFGSLVRFLGLPADEERIDRAIRFSSFEEMKTQEEAGGFIERGDRADRFFRAGKVGAWRNELTEVQAGAVIKVHRQQMARFGYVPEGW